MAGTVLLSIQDAMVTFGEKPLFEGLTMHIHDGDKICLVGKNGAGKTTLMHMITGTKQLDAGEKWELQGTTIGYLQQDVKFNPEHTVFDFVFEQLKNHEEAEMMKYKVELVVEPLHLEVSKKMKDLSGGQVRRAALARALVEDPDILLLDEPTNHLDLDVIEWLENYLKGYRGALLCISHDKTFLKNISNKVFWLDRGNLRVCGQGFAHFDEWSTLLIDQEERELHNRKKFVEQEVAWANKGVKARRKRNVQRLERMKQERDKLKSDVGAFNRMMAKVEVKHQDVGVTSKIVAEFFNVSKSFAHDGQEIKILDKFSLRIMRGDRIGILGKNGSGKTTFLRMLVGEQNADVGKVKLAKTIEFSYFDQRRQELNDSKTLKDTLCPDGNDYLDVMGAKRHHCGYLKQFLFDPKMSQHKVATLSGGQKNRLLLAKILANPKSFLILDEPTNDLDMDTLDMLEDIISQYNGTLIVVSHDRDFLDQTVSKILAFEGDAKVQGVIGGYSDYLEKAGKTKLKILDKEKNDKKKRQEKAPEKSQEKKPVKMSYKLQFEYDNLPEKMATLEQEISELEDALSDASFYMRDPKGFDTSSRRHGKAKKELEQAELRWLELDEMQ